MSDPTEAALHDDPIEIEHSPLERRVERDGVHVDIRIYRGEGDPGWLLEVEDHLGGSTVWDDPFDTEQAALDEALRTIEEDGIESFAQAAGNARSLRGLWAQTIAVPPIADIRRILDASPRMASFHTACGVFAAVATAPDLMRPSTWLELIHGGHPFEDADEAQTFTKGVMSLYNEVMHSLSDFDAHCCPEPGDHEALRAFCERYLRVALQDAIWRADERAYVELLPMLALGGVTSMDKVGKLIPAAAENPDGWLQKQREQLAQNVTALYEYWADGRRALASRLAQQAPVRRQEIKVGRNEPCACGSGRRQRSAA